MNFSACQIIFWEGICAGNN